MHRRDIIRLLAGKRTNPLFAGTDAVKKQHVEVQESYRPDCFKSKWHIAPDVSFTELGILPQPDEAWCMQDGELRCLFNRNDCLVHVLAHQLTEVKKSFTARLVFRFLNVAVAETNKTAFACMRFGLNEPVDNCGAAGSWGNGIDVGITRSGYLFIGEKTGDRKLDENVLNEYLCLSFSVMPQAAGVPFAKLKVLDKAGNTCATLTSAVHDATTWQGRIALVSHNEAAAANKLVPALAITRFEIEGENVTAVSVPAHVPEGC